MCRYSTSVIQLRTLAHKLDDIDVDFCSPDGAFDTVYLGYGEEVRKMSKYNVDDIHTTDVRLQRTRYHAISDINIFLLTY